MLTRRVLTHRKREAKILFLVASSRLQRDSLQFLAPLVIMLFGILVFWASQGAQEVQAGSSHNVSGWAWSENIGWISFNNTSGGGPVNYGVHIDSSTGIFSGYAWSENIGWISFNRSETGAPPSGDPCPDGSCIARMDLSCPGDRCPVSGWAKALAGGTPEAGGWGGWIRLSGTNHEVWLDPTLTPPAFKGWAWSDMVVGWISFNCWDRGVCGTSNYKVITSVMAGTIVGTIWDDTADNVDGACTNPPPPGAPNYTASSITVRYGPCEAWDPNFSSGCTTTTFTGNYSFTNVPGGGVYNIFLPDSELPAGWFQTTEACFTVLVPIWGTATANFGISGNPPPWFQGVNGDIYGKEGISVRVVTDPPGTAPGYNRWFLDADPVATSGGVVISENANPTCGGGGTTVDGRCSRRPNGDLTEPGWRVKGETMTWPPLNLTTLTAEPSFPGWTTLAPNRVYRFTNNLTIGTIGSSITYDLAENGVALVHVRNANLTFNANFISSSQYTKGIIFAVENGQVSINGAVTRIDALILVINGMITVEDANADDTLTVYGMLYAQAGFNFSRTLSDNRKPAVQVKYNPLYLLPNRVAKPQLTWREIAP